ncbi:MAG: sulfite oxidase, partial [Gammaproteobacteria bacterium]|nr:sulfite oxidase [Gammaproteobacteria bacterium]
NGEMKWVETGITHLQLKSFVGRVTKTGADHKLTTIVLNDGTPIKSVEVKIDDGPCQMATADPSTTAKYGWKLYNYTWKGATAGEHTVISRVTDATGKVQPTEAELANKKTFLEDNSQHPRKVMIS